MVQLAQLTEIRERANRYIEYLFREWNRLPSVVSEWDAWEEHERLDFVLEWPIREDRLHIVSGWVDEGLLTLEQCERFAQLQHLIAFHRPSLERLLQD